MLSILIIISAELIYSFFSTILRFKYSFKNSKLYSPVTGHLVSLSFISLTSLSSLRLLCLRFSFSSFNSYVSFIIVLYILGIGISYCLESFSTKGSISISHFSPFNTAIFSNRIFHKLSPL